MSHVLPVTDLKDQIAEVSAFCHREDKPVYLTEDGNGGLVLMSQCHYERLLARIELYEMLDEAELLDAEGDTGMLHKEVIERLNARISDG